MPNFSPLLLKLFELKIDIEKKDVEFEIEKKGEIGLGRIIHGIWGGINGSCKWTQWFVVEQKWQRYDLVCGQFGVI